jgi:hypothetical protein
MNNVDHGAQVYIDGELVLDDEPAWNAADAVALQERLHNPEVPDAPEIRILVGGSAEMTHLKLMHDLYYTHESENGFSARARQGFPFTLDADQFFAMGDNSPYSFDSRYWGTQHDSLKAADPPIPAGVVPRRFLLGRAFFVYWPAGFRPMNGAAPKGLDMLDVPLVPNFGELRFIR